jgi:hypothetical protein
MRFALLLILILPSLVAAQVPPSASPSPPVSVTTGEGNAEGEFAYRGFSLAAPYAEFTLRARALAAPGTAPLVCNTSRRTAQLMECGELIRDPADSAEFYLAAYVLEGQVAFLSFGDSGGAPLVERVQRDLSSRFGRPHASRAGMWEWRAGREFVRLTWRGRGPARWIYISLWDDGLMERIAGYVRRRPN